MSRASRSDRGFTLIEATISMTLLLIVLVLSLSFLFGMRAFAERQELFAEPRQTARRAVDYLSEAAKSASDMNPCGGNPNALITWYRKGAGVGVPTQASWNNVQNAALADVDTDILTLCRATASRRIAFTDFYLGATQQPTFNTADRAWLMFRDGCNDANANMQMLMQLTGNCASSCPGGVYPCACTSDLLMVADASLGSGAWNYFTISTYDSYPTACPNGVVQVLLSPAGASTISAPVSRPISVPANLSAGVRFFSFRVRNNELQQKQGLFDSAVDAPGANFTPLLEDIEDLQVAWVYDDGTIWNDTAAHRLGTTNQVPSQDTLGGATRDIALVRGLRISVTARAPRDLPNQAFARYVRPASEDRAVGAARDRRYHYRLTSTLMIRNRMLGS